VWLEMSTGRKLPDAALSKNHIDEAIKTLLARVDIDHSHWIPYLGGYSKDWSQHPEVYFDARFPDRLKVGGKVMQPFRYILIHESVEKSLMDELGLSYNVSHDFATACERSAVEADGFSWALYCAAIKPYIQMVMKQPAGLEAPKDLDLAPYQQDHSPVDPQLEANERQASS
jgi:hypothetical protein